MGATILYRLGLGIKILHPKEPRHAVRTALSSRTKHRSFWIVDVDSSQEVLAIHLIMPSFVCELDPAYGLADDTHSNTHKHQ